MPVNYTNGKIYQICSNECEEVYIGSTTQSLSMRMGGHRADYKKYLEGKMNYVSSFEIMKYPDAKIYLIEECACENREQLHRREGKVIREANCVNMKIAGRSQREYRAENRERIAERDGKYYSKNREKIIELKAEYYSENRERIAEKSAEYYSENRERIAEKRAEYYSKNREKIAEKNVKYRAKNREKIAEKRAKYRAVKITCECGSIISKDSLSKHRKSKKHMIFVEEKIE